MSNLSMVKTTELKKELDKRGVDTSSVKPASKLWTVGFQKNLWQYFDGIEADTREQAISIARSRLTEGNWDNYNNDIIVESCYESV